MFTVEEKRANEEAKSDQLKIYKTLKDAEDLIKDPKQWCQNAFAKDKNGAPLNSEANISSKNACQWCLVGASIAAAPSNYIANQAQKRLASQLSNNNDIERLFEFNDESTHAQVIRLFKRTLSEMEDLNGFE